MNDDQLEVLLAAMPAIAEAVNDFDSSDVQRDAFRVLMRVALGDSSDEGRSAPETSGGAEVADSSGEPRKQRVAKKRETKATAANSSKAKKNKLGAIPVDETVDLSPSGGKSFPDFAAEKTPTTQQDRSMVIIYWLRNIGTVEKSGVTQIFTCYKKMGWKAPADPRNQLQVLAARKQWLDTSDMDDVRLTHSGSQHVEHALPSKAAK